MPLEERPGAAKTFEYIVRRQGLHPAEYTFCRKHDPGGQRHKTTDTYLELETPMRTTFLRFSFALAMLAASGTPMSVFAQAPAAGPAQANGIQQVRRLTADDAVRLAAENNLGLATARIDPILQDLSIDQTRASYTPSLNLTLLNNRSTNQNTGFLSGASGDKTTDSRLNSDVGVSQNLLWGGNYQLGWTSSRSTTNNVLSTFSPQIRSGLSAGFSQPLLRNFKIDGTRQQLLTGQKQREIADVQLRQTIARTARTVRNAYWDLAYAIASLQVQQQSLELARENLRNTRARIEIGTTPPIDEIEPEAEVARQEENVIIAESRISATEDVLRTLIFNPNDPDFWTIRIEPTERPQFQATAVNVEAATKNALERRGDLQQSRKSLEQSEITIRYLRNQTLPDLTANFDYSASGVGGTQLLRSSVIGGDVVSSTQRSYGAVIGDLFTSAYPTWSASVTVRYPLGKSAQDVSLASARLQYEQRLTQIRQQQVEVAQQVRDAGRQVETNQKRVDTTRRSREFAERRLDAEQRKLAAGTQTNYFVLQAQRDLAQARNTELSAILDYQRSVVDFETVQEIPIAGGAGIAAVTGLGN
jgi:outer membrane protein TolC